MGRRLAVGAGVALALLVVVVGYPVQRHYLQHRYEDPSFTTPGLNAAFKWAQGISDARIATTSTRQYPLYGKDLTNHVDYIGKSAPTEASPPQPPAAPGATSSTPATTTT